MGRIFLPRKGKDRGYAPTITAGAAASARRRRRAARGARRGIGQALGSKHN